MRASSPSKAALRLQIKEIWRLSKTFHRPSELFRKTSWGLAQVAEFTLPSLKPSAVCLHSVHTLRLGLVPCPRSELIASKKLSSNDCAPFSPHTRRHSCLNPSTYYPTSSCVFSPTYTTCALHPGSWSRRLLPRQLIVSTLLSLLVILGSTPLGATSRRDRTLPSLCYRSVWNNRFCTHFFSWLFSCCTVASLESLASSQG